eukprot:TRINITY_DN2777_c0_g1_i3.p1 TRINITY_DN2777_c0_g1~~TRINITY_DN2777_c0_g1_i3.p1  ORF type:complete len:293 (+),score=32.66 TRINITY_DN2777_c0_g1_i3:49-927(+)
MSKLLGITMLSMVGVTVGCQPDNYCWPGSIFNGTKTFFEDKMGTISCQSGTAYPESIFIGCGSIESFVATPPIARPSAYYGITPFAAAVICESDGVAEYVVRSKFSYAECLPVPENSGSDHSHSGSDHSHSGSDHSYSGSDHSHSGSDHSYSGSDNSHSGSDHSHSGSDHSHSGSDHSYSGSDHSHSGSDHSYSGSDNSGSDLSGSNGWARKAAAVSDTDSDSPLSSGALIALITVPAVALVLIGAVVMKVHFMKPTMTATEMFTSTNDRLLDLEALEEVSVGNNDCGSVAC